MSSSNNKKSSIDTSTVSSSRNHIQIEKSCVVKSLFLAFQSLTLQQLDLNTHHLRSISILPRQCDNLSCSGSFPVSAPSCNVGNNRSL